jgi:hypothetical protein
VLPTPLTSLEQNAQSVLGWAQFQLLLHAAPAADCPLTAPAHPFATKLGSDSVLSKQVAA